MKRNVVVLLALFALMPWSQLIAETPLAAPSAAGDALIQTPEPAQCQPDPAEAPDETPALELFQMNNCIDTSECATGELCCNLCGAFPDDGGASCMFCVQPVRNRCPIVA